MYTRIIPVLTFKDQRMMKTINFDQYYDVGDPVTTGKFYDSQDVDELVLLDITATQEQREPDFAVIESFSNECMMPLTIGGGVKSIETINRLLKNGADKIVINSYAIEDPEFITEASEIFGSQCIVISVDSKKDAKGEYYVYTHGGTLNTGVKVKDWITEVEKRGAGEVLINSIDKDGSMSGYDIELTKIAVQNTKTIPVVALGGAGVLQDFVDLYYAANPSALAMSSIFHFTDNKPVKANAFAIENDINARPI